ncbi:hypothetical protein MRS44_008194 [Fusarium solani]|uniref:uncharacterized protein n=1 Tax=Fusarium solani TaxID=169388 RepID=UPI0032C3F856|nr:hypothetical protein MRS44_008194 [Fusarium solani]
MGWRCTNNGCATKTPNPTESSVCLHCGCRWAVNPYKTTDPPAPVLDNKGKKKETEKGKEKDKENDPKK